MTSDNIVDTSSFAFVSHTSHTDNAGRPVRVLVVIFAVVVVVGGG